MKITLNQGKVIDVLPPDDPKEAALEAVLLFHDAGPWTGEKSTAWVNRTRVAEATTKVLCDLVRKVLDPTLHCAGGND